MTRQKAEEVQPLRVEELLRTQKSSTALRIVLVLSVLYFAAAVSSGTNWVILALLVLWLATVLALVVHTHRSLTRQKSLIAPAATAPASRGKT